MRLRDTAPDIRRRQFDIYRAMLPARRVELALNMSEDLRQIALDGIRARNPSFDDARVHLEWLRTLYGEGLAARLAARRAAP